MRHVNQAKIDPLLIKQVLGFSLAEVLVAISILIIILMTVLDSRHGSVRRIKQTGDLNQIQDMVRADLANIRKQGLKWQCIQGTACSGLKDDRDNPPRYSDSHCDSDNPIAGFPVQTGVISPNNGQIELTRNIEDDGKQLTITYTGQAGDKAFTTSTSIIPQAMNWCG
jgi:type II secretory pathway pseudopilin PulG|tara:strand:- start:1124 stop:1627 length:504 start_codon:yes stop_codon:yes gene_type:complete